MVQAGAIGRVADVHARPLAYCFQTFQDLDRRCSVFVLLLSIIALLRI